MIKLAAFQLYLSPDHDSSVWGIQPTDLGYTRIPSHHFYPPVPHPESYTLNQTAGRVLEKYQLIYITRGRGFFWSDTSAQSPVEKGTLMMLFPGIRHRYRPDPATGWDEYWLGFAGDYADRIILSLFAAERPILRVGNIP